MTEQNGLERSSATEELRRLLDGRGVEHEDDENVTRFFGYDGFEVVMQEDIDGKLDCLTPLYLTPEQAIEATLGSDLKAENAKLRELVSDMWDGYNDPRCEECHLKDTPTCADCPICAREAAVIDRMRELGIEVDA